jgi:hypothetical protein
MFLVLIDTLQDTGGGSQTSSRPLRTRGLSGIAAGLDESSGHSALFAQVTFPKEYEVVLEPALE